MNIETTTSSKLLEPTAETPRQALKLEALGQLIEGMAPDFNNLLTVIQGHSARLLADENLRPETREGLTEIYSAGERAAKVIQQLLVFSGKQKLRLQTLDLNGIVGDAVTMLRPLMGEDITLQFNCGTELLPMSADAGMLEEVVMNLALNARDALPMGGEVHIQTARVVINRDRIKHDQKVHSGHFVCLSVRDTGGGITPENLPRIFEPFFTTKARGKGTGLGLAIVFGIVEKQGGWVEVESEVGQGTTFRLFFPALATQAVEGRSSSVGSTIGTETILLVEDEEPVRRLAVLVLQRCGYRVLEAASGVEALKVWGRHQSRIELLLTDLVLPDDLDGWELAKKLRNEKPELKLLYSSAYRPDMVAQYGEAKDRVHFLQKPYHPQKLTEAVRRALNETNKETK